MLGLDLKNVSLFAGSGFDSAIPGAPGKSEIHTGFESQHNMTIQARLQSLLLEWTHTMVLLMSFFEASYVIGKLRSAGHVVNSHSVRMKNQVQNLLLRLRQNLLPSLELDICF